MAKKIKKYNVGLNSETYAISLVENPAIEEDFIALSKEEQTVEVKLSDDEKHIVYGAVLIPDKDIYRNNGENEYYISFSKESIEKMSQDFMKEYRQYEVKTDHDKIADEVCVVETWVKADLYKDKSVALGLNETLPVGTWFAGMKVNNIDTWKRIKSGELKGFSVESMIHLEEFNKVENNNDMVETNDMKFWTKMKEVLNEVFGKADEEVKNDDIEPVAIEDLAEETPNDTPVEDNKSVEEPKPTEVKEEPKEAPVEPKAEEKPVEVEKPKEEPKVDNHLEELINNLKEEISALKEMNTGLQNKIKDLGKQPSTKPVNTNAKPSAGDTYSAWRKQMAEYLR